MKRLLTIFTALTFAAVTSVIYCMSNPGVARQSTVDAAPETVTSSTSEVRTVAQPTELEDDLQEVISEYGDITIGVSVTDIDNDFTYSAGASDTLFKGASTIKVLTAVYLMHQVEAGKLSLTTSINGLTAETQLQRMLQNSDNTAWAALISYLGDNSIEAYAHTIGLTSFSGGDYNTIKPSDFVKLLVKLQKAELTTAAHRDIVYEPMQNTDNERLIAEAISSDVTLYHKWGTLWGALHDVAILQKNGRTFAVVIYTNNETDDTSLNSRQTNAIHELTKVIVSEMDR